MPNPKIIVTGGAGFIGSHTVVELVEHGYEPVVVDDFSNSARSVLDGLAAICGRPIRCHELDCTDRAGLERVLRQEGEVAGVIHFAASKAVNESLQKPLLYYRNNLGGLIAVLEAMLAEGVRDLVFSSSCTVYGQPEKLPVTESTPIAPASSSSSTATASSTAPSSRCRSPSRHPPASRRTPSSGSPRCW
mgnify:CR=1 FL=1